MVNNIVSKLNPILNIILANFKTFTYKLIYELLSFWLKYLSIF